MNIRKIGAAVILGALVVGCGEDAEKNAQSEDKGVAGDGVILPSAEKKPAAPTVADPTNATANPTNATAKADEVVLSVNGEKLTRGAVQADVEAVLKAQGGKIPAEQQTYYRQMAQNQIVQSFVLEKVLVAKAKDAGFMITDADRKAREEEFLKAVAQMPGAPKSIEEHFKKFPLGAARARAEFENGILIDKLIKDAQAKSQAKEDYEAKAKEAIEKAKADNAKAATSEKDALKKINDLRAQLANVPADKVAEKFAELAKANSDCPSSSKGGDLGEFTHGQMVREFDTVAFALPVNKVSEPVKTQFGYHLILTTKKIPAVEAKGDDPAAPEKVRASHILVKAQTAQPVPEKDVLIQRFKKQGERQFVQKFIMDELKTAKIEAFADDFKQFVPSDGKNEKPVDKSAGK